MVSRWCDACLCWYDNTHFCSLHLDQLCSLVTRQFPLRPSASRKWSRRKVNHAFFFFLNHSFWTLINDPVICILKVAAGVFSHVSFICNNRWRVRGHTPRTCTLRGMWMGAMCSSIGRASTGSVVRTLCSHTRGGQKCWCSLETGGNSYCRNLLSFVFLAGRWNA